MEEIVSLGEALVLIDKKYLKLKPYRFLSGDHIGNTEQNPKPKKPNLIYIKWTKDN